MATDATTHPRRPAVGRLRAYDWQLVLRGVAVAVYGFLLATYQWEVLVWSSLAAGLLLLTAGAVGLVGLLRRPEALLGRGLRLADAVVDLVFGGILVACAIGSPAGGPMAFGIWAGVAGLLLIVHVLPTRLRDTAGPLWAWIWTGVPLILHAVAILAYPNLDPVADALRLNAFGLAAATMLCMLGFGLAYPDVLALPEQDSSGETMFAYDDVHWRVTPAELEMHDWDEHPVTGEPPLVDRPGKGEAA